jgi:hypothetical protein
MPRICVREAIAGADFSWVPGDVVDLPEEEAARWADGHRAVLLEDGEFREPGTDGPSIVHQQPLVVGEDGQELEVLAATLKDLDPPAGQEDGPRWVRWSVTVRLSVPPSEPGSDGGGQDDGEEAGKQDGDAPGPPALFDPREHSNREVLAYLDTVGYEEALRVLDLEANEGDPPRAGIIKNRDKVLEAARARDGGQAGAEKAAKTSRGGGRGEQPETREW